MEPAFQRLQLQALFASSSAALGRALQEVSADAPLSAFISRLPPGLKKAPPAVDQATLGPVFEWLCEQGWQWLALGDEAYPPLLAALPDAPGVLAVRGEPVVLNRPMLAMVGARHASADGLDNSHRFARALAEAGFVITSGLALGVDASAHRGALRTGQTVAVMGCGPDRVYPARHRQLADDIVAGGGALVTEFPPGLAPHARHFPQRNRIISGLSLATIVVEAAIRSGSLTTARAALQQGREIFAIPGAIHNPFSKGCHQLLREGANWLESVDDILLAFGDFRRSVEAVGGEVDVPPLLAHFTSGLNRVDELQRRAQLSMDDLARQLSDLELEGWVERVPGGYLRAGGVVPAPAAE